MNTHTTHIPATKRLQRSREDRMLAGVSGGLARYFEIHPAIFRVGFVVLTLLGGAGILIYAAAALVIPDEGNEDSVATAALRGRRDHPWPLIGLGFLAVAGVLLLSRATLWLDADAWALFLIAGALILWVTRHSTARSGGSDRATETTAARRGRSHARKSHRIRRFFVATSVVLAALIAAVLIAVAAVVAVFDVRSQHRRPRLRRHERRRICRASTGWESARCDLDLGELQLPAGETHVDARVDLGDLHVIVPADVAVQVHGTAEVGEVQLPDGLEADGRNVEVDLTETGTRVLVLDAHVGAGSVRVERAVR